jgi:hypothetical protein
MGVGAVFISTLAVTSLPEPHDPPESQMDLLAATLQPIVSFMVLCSIAVHGLSIPFFNLGRRVHSISHTWSRQRSMDTSPEWANQTRRVTKAEDIVINRDIEDKMERGEAEGTPSSPRLSADMTIEDGAASGTASPASTKQKDEIVSQWREGRHLVVERSAPGDDIEVEVIPNAFNSNDELTNVEHRDSSLFQGTEQAVKAEIQKAFPHFRHIEHRLETGLERALGCSPKASFEHDRLHSDSPSNSHSHPNAHPHSHPHDHDNQHEPSHESKPQSQPHHEPETADQEREAEWKDEPIAEGEMLDTTEVVDVDVDDDEKHSAKPSSSTPTRPRSKSNSSKTQSLSKLSGRSSARRREFPRKVLQHHKPQHPSPHPSPVSATSSPHPIIRPSNEPDTSRGRRSPAPREHPSALRLKLQDRRRDSSPARSIRFADEEMDITLARSGYTTPVEPESGVTTPLGSTRSAPYLQNYNLNQTSNQNQNQVPHEQPTPGQGQA